jgi:glycosyltransferase involved in cell wall biosynthesis
MRELTIVIPCLNESETIVKCIIKARHSIDKLNIDGEILVADNGSTDNSVELGARVVRVNKKGYGNALQGGIEAAGGRWIIMADADDSYDHGYIAPFLEKLEEGYELVIGCRFPCGGGVIQEGAMPWMHRRIGNPALC